MSGAGEFRQFGSDHLLVLGIIAILAVLIAVAGGRKSARQTRWIGWFLAASLLCYVAVVYVQKGLAHELSWDYALPLELCHCVMFACAVALFHPAPLAFEIVYYLGLTGTLQATLTPDVGLGFPSWEFILFFWSHGVVLLAVVYLISCRHLRPLRGSVSRLLVLVNLYGLFVGAIDDFFGWNYGYLCRKPSHRSMLDYLGPWPWYLVSLEIVALANFLLLMLPWRILDRTRQIRGEGNPE